MNGARFGHALSPREKTILGAICAGERPYEVAARLQLARSTVDNALVNVRIKLGVRTTYAAIHEYSKLEVEP